jgi:ATP-dependent Lon protease
MDYPIIKSYIEWMADLPYTISSPENFDMENAKKILDSQHFGMK